MLLFFFLQNKTKQMNINVTRENGIGRTERVVRIEGGPYSLVGVMCGLLSQVMARKKNELGPNNLVKAKQKKAYLYSSDVCGLDGACQRDCTFFLARERGPTITNGKKYFHGCCCSSQQKQTRLINMKDHVLLVP